MRPPRRNGELLRELLFPFGGVDLSTEFETQLPGTTPTGKNVRAFEPFAQRQRGGARPGLVQQIPAQVNGTALIQLIDATCVTTDPSGFGGSVYGPQGPGTPGTFIPPVGGSPGDPNAGQGGDGSGGNGGFGQTFNDDRPGDNSHFMHRGGTHNPITLVQFAFVGTWCADASPPPGNVAGDVTNYQLAFNNQVQQGNMLFVVVYTQAGYATTGVGQPTQTMVGDTLGNHYTLIQTPTTGPPLGSLSMFYSLSQASGLNQVIFANNQADCLGAFILEYHNVSSIQPVDNQNRQQGTNSTATPGTIAVMGTQELCVTAVVSNANHTPTAQGGFRLFNGIQGNPGVSAFACLHEFVPLPLDGGYNGFLYVMDHAGLGSAVMPTLNLNALPTENIGWFAQGVTFRPL